MVPLLQYNDEGLVQVINDQVLEKEIRFTVSIINFHSFEYYPKTFSFEQNLITKNTKPSHISKAQSLSL